MEKKNTNLIQEFLEKYKEFEGILRDQNDGQRVLDYEQTLQGTEEEKLRLCRQIRNYIQHHDDGEEFVAATQSMIDFISDLISREKAKEETAQDRLYRLTPISTSDKLSEVVARFAKTKRTWMPVVGVDNVCVGILEQADLIQLISKNKLSTTLAKIHTMYNKKISYIEKTGSIKEMAEKRPNCIVYDKNGKYVGVIRW